MFIFLGRVFGALRLQGDFFFLFSSWYGGQPGEDFNL